MADIFETMLKYATPENGSPQTHAKGTPAAPKAAAAEQHAQSNPREEELKNILRNGETRACFGGHLFRWQGMNAPLLCFAVKNMQEDEIQTTHKYFDQYNAWEPDGFVRYRTYEQLGQYTVFSFYASDRQTLREWLKGGGAKMDAVHLMKKLTVRLVRYQNKLTSMHNSYFPLNCLCLDTVLIDGQQNIYILPLLPHRGNYPIEVPREVSLNNGGSVKSDLFSAAYVSVEFASGGDGADVELKCPRASVLLDCLQVIPSWRPDLLEVYNTLRENGAAPVYVPKNNEFGDRIRSKLKAVVGGHTPFAHGRDHIPTPIDDEDNPLDEPPMPKPVFNQVKNVARKVWDFMSVEEEETESENGSTFHDDQSVPGYRHVQLDPEDWDDNDEMMGEA